MLVPAVQFSDVILGVHILAVVVAFGVTFTYPLLGAVVSRGDPRSTPLLHRMQHTIGTRIINPGLLVVVIAGIYLASHEHQWSFFYVQWGIGISIVLGAIGGGFMAPRERKLIEISERDVNAAAGGEISFSDEYVKLARQVSIVGACLGLLVVATIFIMALHVGVG